MPRFARFTISGPNLRNFRSSWKASNKFGRKVKSGFFWKAKIGGKVKGWEAEITNQVPDERVAWESVDGSPNSGTVIFQSMNADPTKITATIEYEPEGLLEEDRRRFGESARAGCKRTWNGFAPS
jgi:uncharacterized membrane protein